MTNAEKFRTELDNLEKNKQFAAVKGGVPVPCKGLDCKDCDLEKRYKGCYGWADVGCRAGMERWLRADYEEQTDEPDDERTYELTEYDILKSIRTGVFMYFHGDVEATDSLMKYMKKHIRDELKFYEAREKYLEDCKEMKMEPGEVVRGILGLLTLGALGKALSEEKKE